MGNPITAIKQEIEKVENFFHEVRRDAAKDVQAVRAEVDELKGDLLALEREVQGRIVALEDSVKKAAQEFEILKSRLELYENGVELRLSTLEAAAKSHLEQIKAAVQ
jgi:flagellar capping protein FliD